MSDYRTLTRRDFVKDSTLGALALGLAATASRAGFAAEEKSIVAIVRDEKVQDAAGKIDDAALRKMLDEVIKTATGESSGAAGWKKLIKPDDVVGLVPTEHFNKTHPEVIAAVTAAIVEAGVPAGRIQNVQGKIAAAEKCTALVSLPALKTHWLTGLGTVMKNYITFTGKPSAYHQEKNAELGSIWSAPAIKGKTRIVLVDALRPLCAGGPQVDPKYVWNYNGLMAGTDPVAVEATALKILQAKRNAVKGEPWEITPPPLCVAAADKQYKLGTSDPGKIAVKMSGWEKDLLI